MTLRLLAGIGTVSLREKSVTLRQGRDLGEVSYAPLSVLRSQPSVELFVALGGVTTVDLVRTVEVENATCPESALCAGHQALAGCPRRNVDHVDAYQRIGALNRPLFRHSVKPERGKQVRSIGCRSMGGDTCKGARIGVCRLPQLSWQHLCKVGDVLAAAAGQFENQSARWQHAL